MNHMNFSMKVFRIFLNIIERILEHTPGNGNIRTTRYRIESRFLPPDFDGFRFVVLADIHAHRFDEGQEMLLSKIRRLEPELILSVGDFIREEYEGADRKLLRELSQKLLAEWPFYSILGNHEGRADTKEDFIEDFSKAGVRLLQDETVYLTRENGEVKEALLKENESPDPSRMLALTGLYPSYENGFYGSLRDSGYGPVLKAEYEQVMKAVPEDMLQIVLSHRPELFELYQELKMDLVFCGHAHGGLMKLPGGRRLLAPDQGLLPKLTHGPYHKNITTMIVSEGLGGPRIGIFPELILVEMKKRG
ncbi:MAG: metallophosphoesterase [Firmicutes bacterium]|nr:metallophosphoesterase [Bacillota bacterium]